MKILFYRYNSCGALLFSYKGENGHWINHTYLGYSLREALQKFRKENDICHKHIRIIKSH